MKRNWIKTAGALFAASLLTHADVPKMVAIQGYASQRSTTVPPVDIPYHGLAELKFALVNADGLGAYWKNDDSNPTDADEPATAVTVDVTNGLYSVLLGDPSAGMANITPENLPENGLALRTWFRDPSVTGAPFRHKGPDLRIVSVPYAMKVADGAISAVSIADGSITSDKLANGAVTSDKLTNDLELGNSGSTGFPATPGSLVIRNNATSGMAPTAGVKLDGTESSVQARGEITSGDAFVLRKLATNALDPEESFNRAKMSIEDFGSRLSLWDEEGVEVARLGPALTTGGVLKLFQYFGPTGVEPEARESLIMMGSQDGGSSGAYVELRQNDSETTGVEIDGENDTGGGRILVKQDSIQTTENGTTNRIARIGVDIDGEHDGGGYVGVRDSSGNTTVYLDGNQGGEAAVALRDANGVGRIRLAAGASGEGGVLSVRNSIGEPVVQIDAWDEDGNGRVTTEVLEITGGADLSEQFEISNPGNMVEPGSVVCIDPLRPGELRVSDQPCDPTVAGIISGAGGVNPGVLMGQTGSIADGQHPVALTGRVYCRVDADENGPIKPGDLLTTSSIPGHAMGADPKRASGAIIGKAMTGLESGRGLVLVLVSLQ